MHCWKFAELFTETGWQKNMFMTLNSAGQITAISNKRPSKTAVEEVDGWAIPGLTNSHSHSFQYAMAGLTEYASKVYAQDNFWTWREAMYRLALQISPEQFEAIAAMVFAEMLRFGYTSVVEFHYLHKDIAGKTYANPLEMSERLVAAATTAGIHLCIVPIYYRQGDFGKPAQEAQRRFLFGSVEEYENYFSRLQVYLPRYTEADFGVGVHSLRAASTDDLLAIIGSHSLAVPKHLHIAEQEKEVESCVAHLGRRPVEWLINNINLNANYNLVHATHISQEEISALAKTNATVVICPSTEANLGDGVFPTAAFIRAGGRFTIGSDSHIQLSPFDELRWLDYAQRLTLKQRNVLISGNEEESGERLFCEAWGRGRLAAGRTNKGFFAVGDVCEAVVLNHEHPLFIGKDAVKRLSTLIYSGDSACIRGTIRKNAWLVKDQRHHCIDAIKNAYRLALDSMN